MNKRIETLLLRMLMTVVGIIGLVAALFAAAARSDFRFRGCGEVDPTYWPSTANCEDAHGMFLSGSVISVAAVAAIGLAILRLRHA